MSAHQRIKTPEAIGQGRALRLLRGRACLTQRQLADAVGWSVYAIIGAEAGVATPTTYARAREDALAWLRANGGDGGRAPSSQSRPAWVAIALDERDQWARAPRKIQRVLEDMYRHGRAERVSRGVYRVTAAARQEALAHPSAAQPRDLTAEPTPPTRPPVRAAAPARCRQPAAPDHAQALRRLLQEEALDARDLRAWGRRRDLSEAEVRALLVKIGAQADGAVWWMEDTQ